MPDFRRLFAFAKVLTCSCCSGRKPAKTRPYQVDNVRAPPGQEEQDCPAEDQYYGISQSPSAVLPHPDEFEVVADQDESAAAGTAKNEDNSHVKASK
jgi:hypothetical protein